MQSVAGLLRNLVEKAENLTPDVVHTLIGLSSAQRSALAAFAENESSCSICGSKDSERSCKLVWESDAKGFMLQGSRILCTTCTALHDPFTFINIAINDKTNEETKKLIEHFLRVNQHESHEFDLAQECYTLAPSIFYTLKAHQGELSIRDTAGIAFGPGSRIPDPTDTPTVNKKAKKKKKRVDQEEEPAVEKKKKKKHKKNEE